MPSIFTPDQLAGAARIAADRDAHVPSPRVLAGMSASVASADVARLLLVERRVRLVAFGIDLAAIAVSLAFASLWPLSALVLTRVGSFALSEAAQNRLRRGRAPYRSQAKVASGSL